MGSSTRFPGVLTSGTIKVQIDPVTTEPFSVFFKVTNGSAGVEFAKDYIIAGTCFNPEITSEIVDGGPAHGTATVDHSAPGYGMLNIDKGVSEATFQFQVLNDNEMEENETVNIELIDIADYDASAMNMHTVTIMNKMIPLHPTQIIDPELVPSSDRIDLGCHGSYKGNEVGLSGDPGIFYEGQCYFHAFKIGQSFGSSGYIVASGPVTFPVAYPRDLFYLVGHTDYPDRPRSDFRRMRFFNSFPVAIPTGGIFAYMVFRYTSTFSSSEPDDILFDARDVFDRVHPDITKSPGVSKDLGGQSSRTFSDNEEAAVFSFVQNRITATEGDEIDVVIRAEHYSSEEELNILNVCLSKQGGGPALATAYPGLTGIAGDFIIPDALIAQGTVHLRDFPISFPRGAGVTGLASKTIRINIREDGMTEGDETYRLQLNCGGMRPVTFTLVIQDK